MFKIFTFICPLKCYCSFYRNKIPVALKYTFNKWCLMFYPLAKVIHILFWSCRCGSKSTIYLHYAPLMMSQNRAVASGGAGEALAPPVFGRSVNPISTRGTHYPHPVLLAPPDFQTLRRRRRRSKSISTPSMINLVTPKPFWTDQNCFGYIEGQGIHKIQNPIRASAILD